MTTPHDWTHPAPPAPLDSIELTRDIIGAIPSSEIYALVVKGDSLTDALLRDGDRLVMRRVSEAEDKRLMEVDVDGCRMVRRVFVETAGLSGTPTGRLKLVAECHAQPVIWAEAGTWTVLGIVIMVIRHVATEAE